MSVDETILVEVQPANASASGTRRGTLAALLAGSAFGFAALSGASHADAARRHKGKHGHKHNKKNKAKGGKKNGGKGNVGDDFPSVRLVETTTVFDGSGVFDAISKCPEGYVPINGGFFSSITDPQLLTSVPRLDDNAWLIEINGAQQGHQITVTAVCLAATVVVDEAERLNQRDKRGRKKSK